jgi:hypothetical protein
MQKEKKLNPNLYEHESERYSAAMDYIDLKMESDKVIFPDWIIENDGSLSDLMTNCIRVCDSFSKYVEPSTLFYR